MGERGRISPFNSSLSLSVCPAAASTGLQSSKHFLALSQVTRVKSPSGTVVLVQYKYNIYMWTDLEIRSSRYDTATVNSKHTSNQREVASEYVCTGIARPYVAVGLSVSLARV